MEWEQTKIVQRDGAVHAKQEIDHKCKLNNHIWGKFFRQILISFPAVGKTVDVEFWCSHKFAALAHMAFENGDGIVKRET